MPIFSRIALVTSSYSPLFLLLGLVSYERHWSLALVFWALAIGPALLMLGLLGVMWKAIQALPVEISAVRERTEDIGIYATTYLLPFLALTFDSWQTVVALFAFIAFLVLVYLRARITYINPLLLLLGCRLFDVDYTTALEESASPGPPATRQAVAISWWGLRRDQNIQAARIERRDANVAILLVKGVAP